MSITHKDRRGRIWTLFTGKTKTGKPKYLLSQSTSADNAKPASEMPVGYEIYEKPGGQVFCRKKLPVLITDDEVRLVEAELARMKLANCIVERKGEDLIIHEAQGGEDIHGLAKRFGIGKAQVAEMIARSQRYQPVLRFKLMDDEERVFSAFRWCFKGSIDDWYPIDYEKPLADLARRYVKHIGQESFYELF